MELWLAIATGLEYGVLILLLLLSVWSISIMIDRRRALRKQSTDIEIAKVREMVASANVSQIRAWAEAHPGIHARALQAALTQTQNSDPNKVDRAVKSYLTEERLRLEKGLSVLATLGANAPFIGLFGTVLGIIRSFAVLGESTGAASTVMSGISQALLATAAGLFVAIPAVVAFNVFSNRLRTLLSECDSLKDLFIARVGPSSAATKQG